MTGRRTSTTGLTSAWRKSTRSDSGTHEECVEVAATMGGVVLRDSKRPSGDTLAVDAADWRELTTQIKKGKWDLQGQSFK